MNMEKANRALSDPQFGHKANELAGENKYINDK
jgi:hypothetical protein